MQLIQLSHLSSHLTADTFMSYLWKEAVASWVDLLFFSSYRYYRLPDGQNLPGLLYRLFHDSLQTKTAWNFHVDECNAFYIAGLDQFSQFIYIEIHIIQLGTSYNK